MKLSRSIVRCFRNGDSDSRQRQRLHSTATPRTSHQRRPIRMKCPSIVDVRDIIKDGPENSALVKLIGDIKQWVASAAHHIQSTVSKLGCTRRGLCLPAAPTPVSLARSMTIGQIVTSENDK